MATDIYLSKGILEQFSYASPMDDHEIQLWHEPCGDVVAACTESEEKTAWIMMQLMHKHTRECPAGRFQKK